MVAKQSPVARGPVNAVVTVACVRSVAAAANLDPKSNLDPEY